jgi:hypothetical protein
MDRESKVGAVLIVIGICIPLAVLPFVSGYSKEKNIFQNLYQVGIALGDEKQVDAVKAKSSRDGFDFRKLVPRKIPFRLVLAATPVFLFAGYMRLDGARRRKREEPEP